ncbi:MAG: LamG-like jellyroll fold domain-containing protein, partial [Chloroflexota bacterium]
RGGDGLAAKFNGGWLQLTNASGILPEVFTLAVRFRAGDDGLAGTLISQRASSAERSFDLAMFNASLLKLPILSFCHEQLAQNKRFLRVANLHLDKINKSVWHDVIVRCDGKILELFQNGELFDRRVVGDVSPAMMSYVRSYQPLHVNAPVRLCIGANPYGNSRFTGLIDRIAVWNRPVRDAEIASLSGGTVNVEWKGRKDVYTQVNEEGIRSDDRQVVAGMFPAEMTESQRIAAIEKLMPNLLMGMIQGDRWFPRFHVTLPGAIYNTHVFFYKGRWHLFPMWMGDYNYSGWFGRSRFFIAHLSTNDLIHWQFMPFPFSQKELDGVDICNLSFAADGNRVHAFNLNYQRGGAPWHMYSDDADLTTWNVPQRQPVLLNDTEFTSRMDPTVFRDGEWWYLTGSRESKQAPADAAEILGAGGNRESWKNGFPLYRSNDLVNWEYRGCMFHHPWSECAQMVRLGEQYLLTQGGSMGINEADGRRYHYLLGTFENERFVPTKGGRWDYGSEPRFICHTGIDSAGRALNWFTVPLHAEEDARTVIEIGWKGMHALPREIYRHPDGTPAFRPAP